MMLIKLRSSTLPRTIIEAGLTLVKAFFPKAAAIIESETETETETETDEKKNRGSGKEYSLRIELVGITAEDLIIGEEKLVSPEVMLRAYWSFPDENRQKLETESKQADKYIEAKLSANEIDELKKLPKTDHEMLSKLLVKQIILKCLTQVTGRGLPWGILTGIRPAKLLQRMNDWQIPEERHAEIFTKRYGVVTQKIQLLKRINAVQKPYLLKIQQNPKHIAVYISIPFCPSRCTYCSFPGYLLSKERNELQEYLISLYEELTAVRQLMNELELFADSVYFGGGTPTVLNSDELNFLLTSVREKLPLVEDCEITVEAGRPDTLNQEKFIVMAGNRVSRISINPQTMNQKTLQRIGRKHTVEELITIYRQARVLGDWVINMDMILGLPGEGVQEVQTTLEQLAGLKPDNLTVHALAIKRGSKEQEMDYAHGAAEIAEQMQELTEKYALAWGMRPYYLYRQKNIAGNLENIGYTIPGKECRYNIAIMEERRSVIGIGAGASSKIVVPGQSTLTNRTHPFDWRVYKTKWPDNHGYRSELLRKALNCIC